MADLPRSMLTLQDSVVVQESSFSPLVLCSVNVRSVKSKSADLLDYIHQGLICLLSPRYGSLLMTLRQSWSLFHLKHTSFYTIIGLAPRVVARVCCSEKTLMCRKLMRVRKPLSSSRNGAQTPTRFALGCQLSIVHPTLICIRCL